MTLSVSTQVNPIGTKLIKDTDADATAKNDVTGTSGVLYAIEIDNTANSGNAAYLKIYDSAAPTVGTTDPDLIFKAAASGQCNAVITGGIAFTNLSFACVSDAGTAGTTSPVNPVEVILVTT